MSFKKENYNTLLNQAKSNVLGFREAYSKFIERVTIDLCSASLISNYSRSIATIALQFNRVPHEISVDEINRYLYRLTVHEKLSVSSLKQGVYCLIINSEKGVYKINFVKE